MSSLLLMKPWEATALLYLPKPAPGAKLNAQAGSGTDTIGDDGTLASNVTTGTDVTMVTAPLTGRKPQTDESGLRKTCPFLTLQASFPCKLPLEVYARRYGIP